MAHLYIIAGCNGAGKTTTSFTMLPEILHCKEFVNADEIARGLSPFNPDSVTIESGRIMIRRMHDLIRAKKDFAFETTLAPKTYLQFIEMAKSEGYLVTLLYFWLNSPDLAVARVKMRYASGGHDIDENVVRRRYFSGLRNLFSLYLPLCNFWMMINSSVTPSQLVAEGAEGKEVVIHKKHIYNEIVNYE
ncbi:MAG: zeta toxin family protein [Prevotellaceae bacterium]|jgi:predicted ABC-type ATPase|nr:zeta toxin family protein [Prevotellaceae bacterium]